MVALKTYGQRIKLEYFEEVNICKNLRWMS